MSDSQPKIIGEAAYALLVRREEVNVSSLLTEIARMAEKAKNTQQQQRIASAQQWLLTHRQPAGSDNRAHSALRGLSRQEGSVRMPSADADDS
ncbi:hypothetical protein [Pantoea sp. USHLN256]|uniref:hypothetical protein n=1 Tax=Pantoea sp. USHLN256 TaxID=3081293 RepID=UPI0030199A87